MQLAVDIGNSRVKTGLFNGNDLIKSVVSDKDAVFAIKECFDEHSDIGAIIISSVRKDVDPDLIPIPETIHHVMLDPETPLPIQNDYKSKESLGNDRIAAIVGAWSLFPDTNCLVFDAGTCLTTDFIDSSGHYKGGMISPGIQMRLKAMHEFTANLPLLEYEGEFIGVLGSSTEGCMISGSVNGMLNEVRSTIKFFRDRFEGLKVIASGGDAKHLVGEVKNDIFASPDLVLRGLNKILLHNIEKA